MANSLDSVVKIISAVTPHKMIVRKQLITKGTLSYLNIYNILSAESFLLYIPSSYEMSPVQEITIEKLTEFDLDELEKEGGKEGDDQTEVEDQYQKINLSKAGAADQESLEKSYQVKLSLRDPDQKEQLHLCEISRQLHRLRHMVKDIPYKLVIYYKNYVCTIHRSDDIIFYRSKTDYGSKQKLFVSIDLDNFPEQLETIHTDLNTIRNSVYSVIEKNESRNVQLFYSLVENVSQFQTLLPSIKAKRNTYDNYLVELEELLQGVIRSEQYNLSKLKETELSNQSSSTATRVDLEKVELINKLHLEKKNISRSKQKVLEDISYVKAAKDNLDLRLDTILFDSNVMLNRVRLSLESLSTLVDLPR